jgi:hypothetical protein
MKMAAADVVDGLYLVSDLLLIAGTQRPVGSIQAFSF